MNIIEIPKHDLATMELEPVEHPKYKKRSREAYPYCGNCKKSHRQEETEPEAYIYENAYGNLFLHCHRCGETFSVAQFADAVFF